MIGGSGMSGNGGRRCVGCEAAPWAELTAEMRRIKCASELSYGKLAQRTHYSRSSWERFLNQKQLPTRIAVEQFAAAAGQDPRPLLVRLEHSLAHESAARATAGAVGLVGSVRSVTLTGPVGPVGLTEAVAPVGLTGAVGPVRLTGAVGPAWSAGAPVPAPSPALRIHRRPGSRPAGVRPFGLVVAGALLGGLAAELARAALPHRPR